MRLRTGTSKLELRGDLLQSGRGAAAAREEEEEEEEGAGELLLLIGR